MTEILVDTDVFIDHLRGSRGFISGKDVVSYSVITRAELFSGRNVDERGIDSLLAPLNEILVDRTIAQRAGRIRRTSRLRTPDALIAATALERELPLVTRNAEDYKGIKGLKVVAPR